MFVRMVIFVSHCQKLVSGVGNMCQSEKIGKIGAVSGHEEHMCGNEVDKIEDWF